MPPRRAILTLLLLASLPSLAAALGQPKYVTHAAAPGAFPLAANKQSSAILVDPADYPGVLRAARDLQQDINRVTGLTPQLVASPKSAKTALILIGTLGHSPLLDQLTRSHKLDLTPLANKWESTLIQVVNHPFPGIPQALVIAGSDKRGSIFGIYDLSEQIGVSPWYWWADVPIVHQDTLYITPGRYLQPEPAVKYRGIFLNDEAPALTGWVNATYGGYNHKFYEKVFELLLRLKANYLWPAMWNSAFNEDDPENARLADDYGIVMGTSHHEPMLRAQQEWKRHGTGPWDYASNAAVLDKFWSEGIERNKNFESTITLGMRGDGDMPMTEGANIALLEKIVARQRQILAQHATPTLESDPKVWALYKEVQAYYEKGMRVPDDVTLLWCDDNWGNIRRLPTPDERKRPGGAGIYYHFDYVGDPRNYKWLNTNPIAKVWEQMNLALNYGADRIWIVNVGDLKPMEFPIEYFLTLARNPAAYGKDDTQKFTEDWAAREFGSAHATEIAGLVTRYTQYNGRRKPELLTPETFSLTNYNEADRVEADWKSLVAQAESLAKQLPAAQQDAYFELVLHPIQASAIVTQLYIAAGRNHLYAKQGRLSANAEAVEARRLFQADSDVTAKYNHQIANGKWNHMMDQTHLGYTYWQEPPVNVMPAVSEVQPTPSPRMGVVAEGSASPLSPQTLTFDPLQHPTRFLEIFNSGETPFHADIQTTENWIKLPAQSLEIQQDQRLPITIDWARLPSAEAVGHITVHQQNGPTATIEIEASNPQIPPNPTGQPAFLETDNYVSIEAEHTARITAAGPVHWDKIPHYGATLSGLSIFPVTAPSMALESPRPTLEYNVYLTASGTYDLETILGPTLNFVPGRGLRFTVALDNRPPQLLDALAHNSDADWSQAVSDNARHVFAKLDVPQSGYHTLKIGMVDPALVVEKLVLSHGPLKPSYLGPPESPQR